MAASNCAGVILKSVSIEVGTSTGTPQIIQFQNKKPNMVLVITSSPSFNITCAMLYNDCFAPVETTICDGLYSRLLSLLNLRQIASFNSAYPSTGE
jgi:hypothetical protein